MSSFDDRAFGLPRRPQLLLYNPTVRRDDQRDDDRPWYAPSVLEVPHVVSLGKTYSLRGVYLWEVVTNGIASEPIEVLVE